MKIYIVAFNPSENSPHGVGGFDWRVSREDARKLVGKLPTLDEYLKGG